MSDLIRRQRAAQATLDRFNGRPFAWGRADCVRLAAFHLRQMGRKVSLAKAGEYSSLKGALAALKRTGFATIEEAVDGQGLIRIPPAAALVGDLFGGQGEDGWTALAICLGNGRILGFQQGACKVLSPVLGDGAHAIAWRVA